MPWEMFTGKKPDLANFYLIGCIAYTRQQQEKGAKMALRVYRGVLIGYVASNIWYIWNLKKQQVETARDIDFNENRLYNPSDPFVEDELSISSPKPPVQIQLLPKTAEEDIFEANIDFPKSMMSDLPMQDTGQEQSAENNEELTKIGGTGVENSQQADEGNHKYSARQTTPPLPTPDETPSPGNSGSNRMPGTFAESEIQAGELSEYTEQPRDDSPS
jgi:hypothetical protein